MFTTIIELPFTELFNFDESSKLSNPRKYSPWYYFDQFIVDRPFDTHFIASNPTEVWLRFFFIALNRTLEVTEMFRDSLFQEHNSWKMFVSTIVICKSVTSPRTAGFTRLILVAKTRRIDCDEHSHHSKLVAVIYLVIFFFHFLTFNCSCSTMIYELMLII